KSLLVKAIHYKDDDLRMPPKAKLADAAIQALEKWVKDGAAWPEDKTPIVAAGKDHWAFRLVREPAPPPVKDSAWATTPLDRFVLAKLEAKALRPSAPADPRTLIRRVTFDLTGLPPTPEEVDAFLAD